MRSKMKVFMLCVVFLLSIFADRNNSFWQFLYPIEDIDFLNSNLKIIFPPIVFVKFWGFENCRIDHVLD